MTLAVILLNIFVFVSPLSGPITPAHESPPSAQTGKTADAATTQGQESTPSQTQPASSQPTPSNPAPGPKPSASTKSTAHKPVHKKKTAPVDCNGVPAAGSAGADPKPATDPPSSTSTPAGSSAGTAHGATASSVPSNCPPKKVVVDNGSTREPSIQLAGDANSAPVRVTNECSNTSQCLQSAEDNLKKLEGRLLNPSQRDMKTQVQQFVDQSKKAASDGDSHSARTLAWKAQLLSEELVNPDK